LDKNKSVILAKYPNLNDFVNNFSLKNERSNFIKFASTNGVKYNNSEFEKDKEYIFKRLNAYIGRELWGNDGWYSVMLQIDDQFQTAVKLFKSELKTNKVKLKNARK
jgi:carboxyl-terminal processing protease